MKSSKMLLAFVLVFVTNYTALNAQNSQNSKATVYFYRTSIVGAVLQFRYYDGEKNIGKSKSGQIIKYECEPGEHHFGLLIKDLTNQYKPEFVSLNIEPGEEYFVKAELKDKAELKQTLAANKQARKEGRTEDKKSGYMLVNITNDVKEVKKARSKVFKKSPLYFSEEELKEDQYKFAHIVSRSYNEYIGNEEETSVELHSSLASVPSAGLSSSLQSVVASNNTTANSNNDYSKLTIEELEELKKEAIANENYLLADTINKQIALKQEQQKIASTTETTTETTAEIITETAESEDISTSTASLSGLTNNRETALNEILKGNHIVKTTPQSNTTVTATTELGEIVTGKTKIKKSEANKNADGVKYRRSSLYTLMIKNDGREHSSMIKNTFGNFELPEKFNDHNIGPYLIDIEQGVKDQSRNISEYLSTNDIAKQMVSKWFNRSPEGGFNMDLIAERGKYSATDLDIKLAKNKERGMSVIEDAGEELIKNTFVIVNDYKFTNKEEVAKKAGGILKIVAKVASYAGYSDVANVATLTNAGVSVAGKGYVIKTTAYLYQLDWDEETAAIFYNDYWTEDGSIDLAKKEAFEKSDIFKLKLIGSQSAFADLQSTIFTQKSDEGLIEVATVKATDKSIAKLQKKFEDFRTKSPLLSGDPITAKIGLKEGVEKGDKFEVLEQVLNKEGKTEYKRVGIVKVDKNQIWDNRFMADEENGVESEKKYTTFTGAKGKYYSGMLIRQIN
ncbi:hypothetical protein R3X25_11485 [Lutibacter sp. TH_r2]|uniref:hypothetical protein n=1 Tax=Lutibacter sp. TH_r2 TaxID=3082083 RepID=UPI002952CA6C|nr:hypothetical protein [Lutibacter sp. TH_r2]MDV7187904.1 hypothetical protein [Lutibacter sp. TH_r2]